MSRNLNSIFMGGMVNFGFSWSCDPWLGACDQAAHHPTPFAVEVWNWRQKLQKSKLKLGKLKRVWEVFHGFVLMDLEKCKRVRLTLQATWRRVSEIGARPAGRDPIKIQPSL